MLAFNFNYKIQIIYSTVTGNPGPGKLAGLPCGTVAPNFSLSVSVYESYSFIVLGLVFRLYVPRAVSTHTRTAPALFNMNTRSLWLV